MATTARRPRVDPTAWANQRKEALVRAKTLRETKATSHPTYEDGQQPLDALDEVMSQSSRSRHQPRKVTPLSSVSSAASSSHHSRYEYSNHHPEGRGGPPPSQQQHYSRDDATNAYSRGGGGGGHGMDGRHSSETPQHSNRYYHDDHRYHGGEPPHPSHHHQQQQHHQQPHYPDFVPPSGGASVRSAAATPSVGGRGRGRGRRRAPRAGGADDVLGHAPSPSSHGGPGHYGQGHGQQGGYRHGQHVPPGHSSHGGGYGGGQQVLSNGAPPPDDRSVRTDMRSVASSSRRPLHDMSNRGGGAHHPHHPHHQHQHHGHHGAPPPEQQQHAAYTNYGAPIDRGSAAAGAADPLSDHVATGPPQRQRQHPQPQQPRGELQSAESGKLAVLKGRMQARLRRRRERLGLAPLPEPEPVPGAGPDARYYRDEEEAAPPPHHSEGHDYGAIPEEEEAAPDAPPPRYIHVQEEEDNGGDAQQNHQGSPLTQATFPAEGGGGGHGHGHGDYHHSPHKHQHPPQGGKHPHGGEASNSRYSEEYRGEGGGSGHHHQQDESATPHPASTPHRRRRRAGGGGSPDQSNGFSPSVVASSGVLQTDHLPHEGDPGIQPSPQQRVRDAASVAAAPAEGRSMNGGTGGSHDDRPTAPSAATAAPGEEEEYVEIETIKCGSCGRSFGRPAYEKHFDADGNPKCETKFNNKRKVFNSAKARIKNNNHLSKEEQKVVIDGRKKVVKELRAKSNGTARPKKSSDKWRKESDSFREAMRANRLMAKAQKEGKPVDYYL